MKEFGTCHICGKSDLLSFEHVPPKAAYNRLPVKIINGTALVNQNSNLEKLKGIIQQRGFGDYTLCGRCNNNTGRWYGSDYVSWACQSLAHLQKISVNEKSICHFEIKPLRILKQILCLFFSVNGSGFATTHPELVEFVLNKEKRGMHNEIQIFCCLNSSRMARKSGVAGLLNIEKRRATVLSDFAFYPLGYLMIFNSSPPSDDLCDISFFAQYGYDEEKTFSIPLTHLPVESYFPGDYRTKSEIQTAVEENSKYERFSGTPYLNPKSNFF